MTDAARGVVITGAGGDMGRALCDSFLADGFTVIAADKKPPLPRERLIPVVADVTDRASVDDLSRRATECSKPEIWINGAGLFVTCPVTEATDDDWLRIIAVNLTGTFIGCSVALKTLAAAGGGRIVNIGSISGQIGGVSVHPAYGASKAGVHALTKTYASEGARHGVLCNAVAPGLLEAGMVREFDTTQRHKMARGTPLRRLGTMPEIARVVRFLADASNTYMTGAIIPVNGGALMP